MKLWEYTAKDGRSITVRHAVVDDARDLHAGFKGVVEEHMWLPTFTPNSHVSDWMNWIRRTEHSREVLLVALINGEYAGHLSLQPEEWNASQHVAKLGVIVTKECRSIGIGRSLMLSGESAAIDKDYSKIMIMRNVEKAIANGLILPTGETCRKCHNEESPVYRPFDFHQMHAEIAHPRPKKEQSSQTGSVSR